MKIVRVIEYSFYLFTFLLVVAALGIGALFVMFGGDLPSLAPLDSYSSASGTDAKWSQATQVLARDGSVIGEFYDEDRVILNIQQIPDVMKKAIIAVEDERFDPNHPTAWVRSSGIDPIGITRAALVNLMAGKTVQGGSTITQQLAKNLFLTRDRTLKRKIQEIALAFKIEEKYTRDEILERYLNKVFFGNHAYGVASASQRYFSVDLQKPGATLTLGQAAMLAGLAKAPSAYAPHKNRSRAESRLKIVLRRMYECGYISESDIDSATKQFWATFDSKAVDIPETDSGSFDMRATQANFFVEYVKQELLKSFSEEQLKRGGLIVRTTLDPRMQASAEAAVRSGLQSLSKEIGPRILAKGPLEGALLCLDHRTGEILAMVGGSSWGKENQFNRAVQAKRQAGSSFKPFVYYCGLKESATLGTVLRDEQITLDNWTPKNYDAQYHGPVLPRTAITHSYNVAAVQMLLIAGAKNVVEAVGKEFGMDNSAMQPYPSLALGAFEVTLLEITSAYSAWANEGVRYEPIAITEVTDRFGAEVPDRMGVPRRQFDNLKHELANKEVSYLMTSVLQSVVRSGTGGPVARAVGNIPAAGKTGTTDDYADAWFVGYTPSVTCGVWVGFDERRTMGRGMTGGRAAGRIWGSFIKSAFRDTKPGSFPVPRQENVALVTICALSGMRPSEDCIDKISELFLAGTAPTEFCPYHSDPSRLKEFLHGENAADTDLPVWPDQVSLGVQSTSLEDARRDLQQMLDAEAGPPPITVPTVTTPPGPPPR